MKPAYQSPRFVPSNPITSSNKSFHKTAAGFRTPPSTASHASAPQIELYQKESCSFSHAVRNKLTDLGLDFVAHSVPDNQPLKHDQLVKAGGKDKVPFLIDHTSGIKLYDSAAILTYLDKAYGKHLSQHWLGKVTQFVDARVRAWADPIAWKLSSPLLRAQRFQLDATKALGELSGTWDFVKARFEAAVAEAKTRAQAARATADEQDSSDEEITEAPAEKRGRTLKSGTKSKSGSGKKSKFAGSSRASAATH